MRRDASEMRRFQSGMEADDGSLVPRATPQSGTYCGKALNGPKEPLRNP